MAKLRPSRVVPVKRAKRLRSTSLNAAVTEGCFKTAGSDSKAVGRSGMQEDSTLGAVVPRMNAAESKPRGRTPILQQSGRKRTNDNRGEECSRGR